MRGGWIPCSAAPYEWRLHGGYIGSLAPPREWRLHDGYVEPWFTMRGGYMAVTSDPLLRRCAGSTATAVLLQVALGESRNRHLHP